MSDAGAKMSDARSTRDALADVHVRAVASNGSGVADLPDGRVVFIPRTAPGDHARVRLGKVKRRWAQASVVELLEQAPNRIDAPCALFDTCGGCTLQHLPYEDQLEWKSLFVSDAMKRIGGLEVDPPTVLPSPRSLWVPESGQLLSAPPSGWASRSGLPCPRAAGSRDRRRG